MKFVILFCLLITIPFLIIGTITYRKYSDDVERNTTELTSQLVDQIILNLDRYIREMERLTLMPHYNEDVMQILNAHRGPYQESNYQTVDESSKMTLFISSLSFDRSEIESLLIFANDGSIFSSLDLSARKIWNPATSDWMERVKQEDGGLTIIPPHKASYYVTPKEVVSISRVIREPYTNETLGIVKVDLTPRSFESMLSSVRISDGSVLYISDGTNAIYSSDAGVSPPDDTMMVASTESAYSGLKVTAVIPRDDLRKDARELIQFTLIVSLIALFAAYAAAVISSKRLVNPIAHLLSKMRQVQRGLFQERAVVTTNDEIGQLTEGFNTMIGEIDRLVKEVYETRLREREAELSALQSQIHPHFLYNTLEMMNMLALQGNGQQLSTITTSLGKLLRYTVDKQEQQVRLQDELRFVESYLQIQAMRLGDQLQSDIYIDSSYDYCMVPKLLLQPIVENIIEHAMGAAPVRMSLMARVEDDDLILIIEDNGRGMSPERMKRLEAECHRQHSPKEQDENSQGVGFGKVKKGFALRNVHQRVRLLYGEPYGLYIDHTVTVGMRFSIRLPIQWRE